MATPGVDGEFVEGWVVAQVLGEGAYGEVRLLVHGASGAMVALKSVLCENSAALAAAKREAALQRALRHPHVLRCLGARHHPPHHHAFLEVAAGGELFDRIEPEAGCSGGMSTARRYMRQLLAGLSYLHARGVAHRDIKPENLLLDLNDNIKISDFGMATVFRHEGRERLLTRVCGTVPYAAPEVLAAELRPYRAPPADLWAAAVTLVALLIGELPWARADTGGGERWESWLRGAATEGWWSRTSPDALPLLRWALRPDPNTRPTIDQLLLHPWLVEQDPAPPQPHAETREWCSQPGVTAADGRGGDGGELSNAAMDALISYSQPAATDDLLLHSQATQLTQGASGWGVVRMTRAWVRGNDARALATLHAALDALHYTHRAAPHKQTCIECGEGVVMRAWPACSEADRTVLEFRRSRGCGLAFKRHFRRIRDRLADMR